MYEAEGIEWKYIEYPDNAPCLQLLEDRPMGMWCLLDEEGMLPKGSNEGWITKLYSQYLDSSFDNTSPPSTTAMGNHLHGRRRQSEPLPPKHQLFHKPSTVAADIPTISDTPRPFLATNGHRVDFQFIISHFAGKVLYEKDAYLQKNQDTLPAEAIDLCGWSTCPIVRSLLAATPGQLEKSKKASQQQSTHRPLARQPSNLRSTSVSAQFRFQLDDLIQVIGCTQARFIRCVKSNDEGVPAKLTPPRVLQQLRSGGVLEAVRIARAGYAVRVDHDRFLDAFGFFGKWSAASKAKQGPSALSRLQAKPKPRAALSPSELKAQVETTAASMLVHYHKGAPSLISAEVLAVAIQVVHAGKVLDRDVFQATCGTVGFQIGRSKVFFRKDVYNALRRFRVMTQCLQATCIQRLVRGLFARRLVATMHRALVRLQTWTRERLAYRARRLAGAIVLQTWWRGVLAQTRYTRQRRAIPRLQRWLRSRRWRRVLAQRILAKQKSAPKFPPKEPPPMVKSKPHVPITVVQVAAEKSVVVPTPPPPLSPVKMVATAPLPRPHEVSLDASEIPQQLPRREVDALMVSLSVENAHLKQEVIQLRRQQQTVTSPVVAETPPMDPSLEFAISHIRTLATQLVELQLQCALMQNADHHPSVETPHNALLANATPPHNPANSQWTLDLVLPPPPVNLTEAHVQLQTLVGKIQVAAQSLDQLERQKRHQMKIRATEAQAMAVVQTLQPVVATVRNVVSYVPVVSYVVSQVETRVHVSPKTWCLLLQTSQSIVDTVTSLAASLLSRGDARRPPPSPLKELHSDALVPPHLKHQLDEMMETNLNQAMQIKQLTATVHDLRAKHHALQLKMLEDQVAALHVAKGQDNEKLKRMEDDLAYTTACVAQLANTMLARGVAKDKSQVVAAFDARPDLPGHFRR
ncbi:hypothetical protein DYB32_009790 [Aphanomyces invadans]|uniref:Myosin motor domain-containing protein n=1 Tax=Aphanomyces invadans TaxID=157072 RepID=A0A3R7CTN9_9STRA|nr:hypothetical protein DYB32_009790 [Aphanomyces invadans]